MTTSEQIRVLFVGTGVSLSELARRIYRLSNFDEIINISLKNAF